MALERVERRQNHWLSIHRRYGLLKHFSGSTIKRCAIQFLIWLRPWRENRLVSDMARLADFTVWPRKSFCPTATIKRPVLEKIVGGQFGGRMRVGLICEISLPLRRPQRPAH